MINNNRNGDEYEYETSIELSKPESVFISIPKSLILDMEIDIKGLAAYSFLRIRCGLDDTVGFLMPELVEWCGFKSNINKNQTNDKFISVLDSLRDKGYLDYLTKPSRNSYMKCNINIDFAFQQCQSEGFAVIYLDELEKILGYRKNKNSKSITVTTLLLVFLYLRCMIYRRPNKLRHEERNIDGTNNRMTNIQERRKKHPEAYNANFDEIYETLGISKKTFTTAIEVLEIDLRLIIVERPYRSKLDNGKYITPCTIFANAYKREDKYLLASGEAYFRNEIIKKVELIKRYQSNYAINKNKSKTMKGGNNG